MKLILGTSLIALLSLLMTSTINAADFNGDGKTDFAVIRKTDSGLQWIADFNHDGKTDLRMNYGKISDKVILGDFNGDGKTDLAVIRKTGSGLQWIVDFNHDGKTDLRVDYGKNTDIPVAD